MGMLGKRGKKEHFCLFLALFGGNQFGEDEDGSNSISLSHEAAPEQLLRPFHPSICNIILVQKWGLGKAGQWIFPFLLEDVWGWR